jgi:hypothetical protein
MPTQAHLFVGIPATDPAALLKAINHFGLAPPTNQNDLEDWDNAFTNQIKVEGKDYPLEIYFDGESGADWPSSHVSVNAINGQRGGSYALLGVALTSRYSPSIVDEGWNAGGRPEPFVLDLNRLATIRADVQKVWPDADILMMDFHH